MREFQIWLNENTGEIYETRSCQGQLIMYTPLFGSMFIDHNFIDNPKNGWVFIGDLN